MAAEITLTPAPSLYALSPHFMSGVLESPALPTEFETAPKAWKYAFDFTRVTPADGFSSPMVVRVTLEVLSGRVGVGISKGDSAVFLDEVYVDAGSTSVAEVLVADPAEAGNLIVRNASSNGTSHGRIVAIESFTLQVDRSVPREPGLSSPRPTPRWNRYYGNWAENLVEKVRSRAFEELSGPEVVRWSDGLSFRVVPNDQVSRALYVSGTYEPHTLAMLRRFVRPGHVFVDVGANAGVFSLVASHYVGRSGRVFSFEPSQREYQRLCDAVSLNGIGDIVTPLQAAVGARAGREVLRVASEPHSGLNTLGSDFPYKDVAVSALEQVEVTTLDDCARDRSLGRIDVIKIDIEGAEAAALAGAAESLRRYRPVLILEVFSRSLALNGSSVADVQRHLVEAQYRLFGIDDETADLVPLSDLAAIDEQNIVALPAERDA